MFLLRAWLPFHSQSVCRFLPYLKKHCDPGDRDSDLEWVDTARDYPNLLTLDAREPLLCFKFEGTTDTAVIRRSAIRYLFIHSFIHSFVCSFIQYTMFSMRYERHPGWFGQHATAMVHLKW